MKARAMAGVEGMIKNLLVMASEVGAGTPEFKAISRAIESLNSLLAKKPEAGGGAQPMPLPVPATPPGAGVGGMGSPPTGMPMPGAAGGPAGE
jgi:hypothetical protein